MAFQHIGGRAPAGPGSITAEPAVPNANTSPSRPMNSAVSAAILSAKLCPFHEFPRWAKGVLLTWLGGTPCKTDVLLQQWEARGANVSVEEACVFLETLQADLGWKRRRVNEPVGAAAGSRARAKHKLFQIIARENEGLWKTIAPALTRCADNLASPTVPPGVAVHSIHGLYGTALARACEKAWDAFPPEARADYETQLRTHQRVRRRETVSGRSHLTGGGSGAVDFLFRAAAIVRPSLEAFEAKHRCFLERPAVWREPFAEAPFKLVRVISTCHRDVAAAALRVFGLTLENPVQPFDLERDESRRLQLRIPVALLRNIRREVKTRAAPRVSDRFGCPVFASQEPGLGSTARWLSDHFRQLAEAHWWH